MRISGLLLLAIPFVSATVLNVASRDDSQLSINPTHLAPEDLRSPLDIALPTVDEVPETNAQRLARGLGPLSPKGVHSTRSTHRRPTRVHAARAGPSPTSLAGALQVIRSDGTVGFVGKGFNIYGEYGFVSSAADALPVSASAPVDGSAFDLLNENSDQSSVYPFIGLTNGFASSSNDMTSSSPNYVYLTGVQQSQAGSSNDANNKPNSFSVATNIPEVSESVVWTWDAVTGDIKANWYNTDGTSVPLSLLYYTPDNVILASAGADQLKNEFGADNLDDITIKFVVPSQ